jgi:hypothetical protein
VPPAAPRGRCGAQERLAARPPRSLAPHSLQAAASSRLPALRLPEFSCTPRLLGPAVPDAAPPDGDMGVPSIPEVGGRCWGPLILAFFLAASRGKVRRQLGEEHWESTAGWGAGHRRNRSDPGVLSTCCDLYSIAGRLLGPPGRVQQRLCPSGIGHICALTAVQAASNAVLWGLPVRPFLGSESPGHR